MFTTILKHKSDQLNKTSRRKCENKMESKFNLDSQNFLVYPTSKALKIKDTNITFKNLLPCLGKRMERQLLHWAH
jgi:hypothetical protein